MIAFDFVWVGSSAAKLLVVLDGTKPLKNELRENNSKCIWPAKQPSANINRRQEHQANIFVEIREMCENLLEIKQSALIFQSAIPLAYEQCVCACVGLLWTN